MAEVDRRRHPRVRYQGVAVIKFGEAEVPCQAGNISASGMLVYPPMVQPPVSSMRVVFTLPDLMRWVELDARFVREDRRSDAYGWGLRFTRVLPDDVQAIEDYILMEIQEHGPIEPRKSASGRKSVTARPSLETDISLLSPEPALGPLDEAGAETTVRRE